MIGVYVRLAVVAIGAIATVYYFRVGDTQPTVEPLADVATPPLTTDLKQGERAFETNCASCHGVNAAGKNDLAPPLVHNVYKPSHHSDMAFVLAVKQGVRQHHWQFGNMPPQPGVTDEQVRSIIAYVRALQRARGIE
ncbi:MAG: cytochrome c [Ahrensia sp.]|nr:cytochrome c [Ahrensia sp.]